MIQIKLKSGEYKELKKMSISEDDVKNEIEEIISKSLTDLDNKNYLKLGIQLIDLTTLEATDTVEKVIALCDKAKQPITKELESKLGAHLSTAAVCVFPTFVSTVQKELKNSSINIASVSTGFPSGQTSLDLKIMETQYAIEQGANEIDMVINRGLFLSENYQDVYDEIVKIKEVCGDVHLKVILEVGELETLSNIQLASDIAILAGADFIKTSTGKIPKASTLEAVYVMCNSIFNHYKQTKQKIGLKPAGGIKNSESLIEYLLLVHNLLGSNWLNKDCLRFGASSLLDDLVHKLEQL